MDSLLVSIVIPTFNRPRILEKCLDSIAKLEYPVDRFEVIVVNDGGSVVALQNDAKIQVTILSQPNSGPGAARNTGARAARGKFIAFVDDDCVVPRDWLSNLTEAVAASPGAMIGGRTVNVLTSNTFSATSQSIVDYVCGYYNGATGRPRFFASNNFTVPADLFRSIGGFDERFRAAEDRDFCLRWNAAGLPAVYADSVVVMHAHELGVRSLHSQHFWYGRGAYRYWKRAARSGVRFRIEPLSFYSRLLAAPFKSHSASAPLVAALTLTAQVANAMGFFYEMGRSLLLRRSTSFVDDPVLHHKAHTLGDVNIL
jgi:GT2 family glycosyltransferase